MINKSGRKFLMDVCNKPADSKRYVPFMSNHPRHCLTDIPFSFASIICTFVENENVKEKRFKEVKRALLEEASILRAKEIPLEILRQPK